jgi:hypothetical protein
MLKLRNKANELEQFIDTGRPGLAKERSRKREDVILQQVENG